MVVGGDCRVGGTVGRDGQGGGRGVGSGGVQHGREDGVGRVERKVG